MWRTAAIATIVVLGLILVGLLASRLGLGPVASGQIALATGAVVLLLPRVVSGPAPAELGRMLRYALIWAAVIAGAALVFWAGNRLLLPHSRLDDRIEEPPVSPGPTQSV